MARPRFFALVAILFVSVVSGASFAVLPPSHGGASSAAVNTAVTDRPSRASSAAVNAAVNTAVNTAVDTDDRSTICDVATPILRSIADAMRVLHGELAEENLRLSEDNWLSLDKARSTIEHELERLLALAKGSVVVFFMYIVLEKMRYRKRESCWKQLRLNLPEDRLSKIVEERSLFLYTRTSTNVFFVITSLCNRVTFSCRS